MKIKNNKCNLVLHYNDFMTYINYVISSKIKIDLKL